MSQEIIRIRDGKAIIREIRSICGESIIRENTYFWKIENEGKLECYMIQNKTNDYYGVTDAIRLYRVEGEWYRDIIQCLRRITDENHARIIYKNKKKIYTAIYKK